MLMRFNKVLLVNPKTTAEWTGVRPPAGLGYIAQALLENNVEYDVLDMQLGYTKKNLFQRISLYRPDIIGFSLVSLGYKKTYDLINEVKANFPENKIIVGGPHVTILKEQVLKDCSSIDFAAVYEGEITLVELCKSNQEEKFIKGIIFRDNGKLNYSGDREWVLDLDSISYPRYWKFEHSKYIKEIEIFSSRGCLRKCIFCPNAVISPHYRSRSPVNVVNEIEYWYGKGYRQFNFDDDNFNFSKERVYLICDEIEKRRLKNLYLRCSNGLRADKLDKRLLRRMKEVGFKYIAIGADGGNNHVLKMIKKGETIEQIESVIKDACDIGIEVKLLCIIGHPGETIDDIEESLALAKKYPITRAHFYNPIPYPGTEFYRIISEKDYFIMKPEQYLNEVSDLSSTPVFATPELSLETRIRLLRKSRRVQKEITAKAIQRMYNHIPLIGRFMGNILSNGFFQKMFFTNFMFRKLIDYIRYKKAIHNH